MHLSPRFSFNTNQTVKFVEISMCKWIITCERTFQRDKAAQSWLGSWIPLGYWILIIVDETNLQQDRTKYTFETTFGNVYLAFLCNIEKGAFRLPTPSSQPVSRGSSISPYRCFRRRFRRESRRCATKYNETVVARGRVRVSTLAFRTFGLFRTAASQRRDLPPPEELFFSSPSPVRRVHPLRPAAHPRPPAP